MYVLHNNQIQVPIWNTIRKLNTNLKATIKTKDGQTETIKIKDSIRQGGVLSVILYALLMDEIAKEITKLNKGCYIPGTQQKIGCLLWVDDVVLMSESEKELQEMLDITHKIAKRYHIEFGKEKSKAMQIGKGTTEMELTLGNMKIEYTKSYKYLGETINNKLNMENQIQEITRKAEAAYQTILTIAGDKDLKKIKMETIWKLLETCIKPIITYGAETWDTTKKEMESINRIYDKILKRILKLPTSTPREVLYLELKLMDIEHTRYNNQMTMLHRLQRTKKHYYPT